MNSTIIVSIFTLIGVIFGSLLTATVTIFSVKYNFNIPKTREILEKQYSNVIMPLHKIIFWDKDKLSDKIKKSQKIIESNFEWTPTKLIKYFNNEKDLLLGKDFYMEYCQYILDTSVSQKIKLGYDRSSFKKKNLKLEPIIIFDKPNTGKGGKGGNGGTSKRKSSKVAVTPRITKGKANTPVARANGNGVFKARTNRRNSQSRSKSSDVAKSKEEVNV